MSIVEIRQGSYFQNNPDVGLLGGGGLPHNIGVGAALIKKYSSYCTNKKKVSGFFSPKTGARGPEITPRQVADASPLVANFVHLLLLQNQPPWH